MTAQIAPCDPVDLVGKLSRQKLRPGKDVASLNDVWGWTDPQTGVEYALVGRHDGLSIVDLSTPVEPRPIAFLPSAISHTSKPGKSRWASSSTG